MSDKQLRHADDLDLSTPPPSTAAGAPGRLPATARIAGSRNTYVTNIYAARDASGVADGAETIVQRAAASTGAPLPADLRGRFESSLGTDLSDVRIHTGDVSAEASRAVGAKAYAVGSDIHFGAGQYDPSTDDGLFLVAHEVAHTVQQRGGAPMRQHKLEVSAPGDAAEVEADRAAAAMVAGEQTTLARAASLLHRDRSDEEDGDPEDAADKAWAEDVRTDIREIVDQTTGAKSLVNGDATGAIAAVEGVKSTYAAAEKKYDSALQRFKAGVAAAQEREEQLRAARDILFKAWLSAAYPLLGATQEAMSSVLGKADDVATLLGVGGIAQKKEKSPSEKGAGPHAQVDWKNLLDVTIRAFRSYLLQNKALDSIVKDGGEHERFLSEVIEGKHAGKAPRDSVQAQKAEEMANGVLAVGSKLDAISGDEVSSEAVSLQGEASAALDGVSPKKMEQDIAIKWISSLTREQRDEIDTADSYLKQLNVIDGGGNRLDYDTGDVTLEGDEVMIHLRAQVEQMAINATGGLGEWLGGRDGNGRVRDATGNVWPAMSADPICESPGGQVRILSYVFAGTQDIGDDMSRPGSEMEIKQKFIDRCTFTITPVGPSGTGVYDGPALYQGKPRDPDAAPPIPPAKSETDDDE